MLKESVCCCIRGVPSFKEISIDKSRWPVLEKVQLKRIIEVEERPNKKEENLLAVEGWRKI